MGIRERITSSYSDNADPQDCDIWQPPEGVGSWEGSVSSDYGREAAVRLASRFTVKSTVDGRGVITSSVTAPEVPKILRDRAASAS